MILKDAGVAEFICPEFTVRFPPPPPPVVEVKQVVVPVERGKVTGGEQLPEQGSNYDRVFRGNKPRLFDKAD